MSNENIKIRRVKANVKGKIIEFDEYYMIDDKTKEEIFNRDIEIENDIRLYDLYKKQMNLLTSSEIKSIRKKYNMTQKEFALAIGVGEITIHRFENGSIQTDSVDSIIRLSEDPNIMASLILKNKVNFSQQDFNKFYQKIDALKKLKHHKIASFNKEDFINLNFATDDVSNVANQLIIEYNTQIDKISEEYGIETSSAISEYITPLKLQKLLYYIQGLALNIYEKPAFFDNIYAWQYGPVVEKIYKKYKGSKPILTPKESIKISVGLQKIIELVVSSYGQIEAKSLIDLTHDEEPWLNSNESKLINPDLIKNYFDKVYNS